MPDDKDNGPVPIFVSYMYDFEATKDAMGGDGPGRPGSLGGPIGEEKPKFTVLIYQYVPPPPAKEFDGFEPGG
jgi:hypothetical protein